MTVRYGNKTLAADKDYTVAYSSNTNAGTATVTITGKGNYSGTVKKTFTIAKASQSITAKAKASAVSVGKTTAVSVSGAKGKVTYKSSNAGIAAVDAKGTVTGRKVGTASITVTSAATGNYKAASKTVKVKVTPAATKSLKGKNIPKGLQVTWAKVDGANGYILYRNSKKIKTISSGATVTYNDTAANTNGARYVYKLVAKASTGTSSLSRSLTFYKVAGSAISSLKNTAAKTAAVKWGRNAKATGYQIQYSLKKDFASSNKTVTVKGAGSVSKAIAGLKKGKTYYFRVRAYKKVGETTYYSSFSPAKKVVITK